MALMIVTVSLKDDDFKEQTFDGRVVIDADWAKNFDAARTISDAIAEAFEKVVEGKPATAFKEYDGDYTLNDQEEKAWAKAHALTEARR